MPTEQELRGLILGVIEDMRQTAATVENKDEEAERIDTLLNWADEIMRRLDKLDNPPPPADFKPTFKKGDKVKTVGGDKITILYEIRDRKHAYDHVVGSDSYCRYDRPGDVGRYIGQNDPNNPLNLVVPE